MSNWLNLPCQSPDVEARTAALARQAELTKPPGALGRLEDIAVRMAALQGAVKPELNHIHISVFAADHGVVDEGVSAFPQAVTAEMVKNFARGGAAISVLARALGAQLEVVNLGTAFPVGESLPGVVEAPIAPGCGNIAREPAMSAQQLDDALGTGRAAVQRALDGGAQLFIGGDMGIGNTTPSTAIACRLLGLPPATLVGPGTGLDRDGVNAKSLVISAALALHEEASEPLEVLRHLGGFEIAALAGAYLSCAQLGLPVLVDGFIASAAALVAVRHDSAVGDWLFLSHASAEPGHAAMTQAIGQLPILDLGLRLGEGSGAATAAATLRLACQLHSEMATFAEAAVSEKL